jgi:hypothetical protein
MIRVDVEVPDQAVVDTVPPAANVPVDPTVVTVPDKFKTLKLLVRVFDISSLPPIVLTAPDENAIDSAAVVPLDISMLPDGMVRPPEVNVAADDPAWKFAAVLLEKTILPTVWVGIFVTVELPPLLKFKMSVATGVVLLGVQFVAVAQEADPEVAFQVYDEGAEEVKEISSIAAGGFTISEPSVFQLKTKRYVVPGIPVNAIVLEE